MWEPEEHQTDGSMRKSQCEVADEDGGRAISQGMWVTCGNGK